MDMKQDLNSNRLFRVGIPIFNQMDVLDFTGPFEVFSVAGRILSDGVYRDDDDVIPAIQALAIGETDEIIHTRGKLPIKPHYTFDNHPPLDLLVVPGGWGTRREVDNPVLIDWLRRVTQATPVNASVCTGAFLLGKIGLFDGHKATTHWASLDRMETTFPNVQVIRDVRWVDEGNVVSSAGISAGIDMSLHLVERLFGLDLAERTARQMDYRWQRELA
jgi:transcriptional regulator GlxA family with amidase domain